jgi:uncharacterized protein (TIGR03435 family)
MRRRILAIYVAVALGWSAGDRPRAQVSPTFEIVSIKPIDPLDRPLPGVTTSQPSGQFRATNVPVATLIQQAFMDPQNSEPLQLIGAPDWVRTDKYQVEARFTEVASREQLNAILPGMILKMLETRFNFKAQIEVRTRAAFVLVRSRTDRLGPQLRGTNLDCDAGQKEPRDARAVARAMQAGTACDTIRNIGTRTTFRGITMADFAKWLVPPAGRHVVDQSGLMGRFDFELDYTREPLSQSDLPPIFTALQEQLGMKLESREVPQPVIVVEHVDRPSPN